MTTIAKIAEKLCEEYPYLRSRSLDNTENIARSIVAFVLKELREPPRDVELIIDTYFNHVPLSGFGKIPWQRSIDAILNEHQENGK